LPTCARRCCSGFLRSYADYLGLDADAGAGIVCPRKRGHEDEVPIAEPGKPRYIDYRPLEVELLDTRPSLGWLRWVLALADCPRNWRRSWWFLGRGWATGWSSLAFWVAPTSTPTATNTPTPWIITATPSPVRLLRPYWLRLRPTCFCCDAYRARDYYADLSADGHAGDRGPDCHEPDREPARVGSGGRRWEVVQEGILEPGESRFWNAGESMSVRTGKAEALA